MSFRKSYARRGLRGVLVHPVQALFGIAALQVMRMLPLSVASGFGGALFRLVGPFLRADKVARRNLARVFPGWDKARIDEVMSEIWDNLGRGAGEFTHAARINPNDPNGPVEVVGLDNLLFAQKRGAFIIMSAHMANWEMAGIVATRNGSPMATMYRPADNPWMDRYFRKVRGDFAGRLIPKGRAGMRETIQSVKQGEAIGVLIDQKLNEGVPVPFFGRPAMTASAPVEMALRHNVPILPVRIERVEKTRIRVTIHPPMAVPDTGDRNADVLTVLTQFHEMLEEWIRARPGQWFWVHKRWPD